MTLILVMLGLIVSLKWCENCIHSWWLDEEVYL